jgi:EF hand
MKTSTTVLIAVGAVLAGLGIVTAVNADSGWRDHGPMGGPGSHHPMPGGPMMGGPMMGGPMMGGPMGAMMGPMVMRQFLESADADSDGKVTQAEIDGARKSLIAKYDANGDGKLNLEEFDALFRELTRPVMVRTFQFLDPDGDGLLVEEELDRPASRIVEFLDRNGDGALSPEDRPSGSGPGFHFGRYDEN